MTKQDAGRNVADVWPLQTIHTIKGNYGQAQRNINTKPCSRNINPESEHHHEQQWVHPIFTSKFAEPTSNSDSTNFMPQALKNEEHKFKTTYNHELFPNPPTPLNTDGARFHKTRNSLPVTNPPVDSFEERFHELIINNNEKTKPAKELHSATSSEFDPPNEYIPNDYLSTIGNVIDSGVSDGSRSSVPSEYHGELTNDLGSEPVKTIKSLPVNTLLRTEPKKEDPVSQSNQVNSALTNKCADFKDPNNLVGHSRRSMSDYNDDNDQTGTAKDIFNNDKELPQYNNDPYQESRIDNENAMASVLNAEPKFNTQKLSKAINLSNIDKPKSPSDKSVTRLGKPQFNQPRREMIEPTKGAGISNMGKSGLMLLQSERVCYACSTANNPTCWSPDRRTTVKYCRKGNNACITKTFGIGSEYHIDYVM